MDLTDPMSAAIPAVPGRVLQVLARAGLPLTGSAVAQLAGASPEGARKVLLRLRDQGLVTARPAGSAVLYEANRRHLLWPAVERLAGDADQVVDSVKRLVSATIDTSLPPSSRRRVTAALYGSVARGESDASSDVDVLLVLPDEVEEHRADALVAAVTDEVTAATGNDCHVYAVSRSGFDDLVGLSDPMLASWVADAVVFHGPDFRRRLRGDEWDGPSP